MSRINNQRKVCDSDSDSDSVSELLCDSASSSTSSESATWSRPEAVIDRNVPSHSETVSVRNALAARSAALASGRMIPLGTSKTVPSHVSNAVAHDLVLQNSARTSSVRMRQVPGQEKLGMLARAPKSAAGASWRSATAIDTPTVSSPAERNSYRQAVRYRMQLTSSAPVPPEDQRHQTLSRPVHNSRPSGSLGASKEPNEEDMRTMLDGLSRVAISDNLGSQPEEVVVTLKPHQRQAVDWMMRCEQDSGLRGGILADDMGLGKTVQSLALLMAHKPQSSTAANPSPHRTLVVAPTATLGHWRREAQSRIRPGLLHILVYHGSSRKKSPKSLAEYDLVITSYGIAAAEWGGTFNHHMLEMPVEELEYSDKHTLSSENYGPLFKTTWRRIILDEAHVLKNRRAQKTMACSELVSQYRWCLTGTPIQNSINDIYPLLRFLRIPNYCCFENFQNLIKHGDHINMSDIRSLLKRFMLRRTKATIESASVQLPLRFHYIHRVDLSMAERLFYDCVILMNTSSDVDNESETMMQLFHRMLRMRQSTSHPSVAIPSNSVSNKYFTLGHLQNLTTSDFWLNTDHPMCSLLSSSSADNLLCRHCHALLDHKLPVSVYRCGAIVCYNCAHKDMVNPEICPGCEKQADGLLIDPRNTHALADNEPDNGAFIAKYACKSRMTVDARLKKWYDTNYFFTNSKLPSAKMRRVLSILKTIQKQPSQGEKSVIFSEHLNAMSLLSTYLSDHGFNSLTYHGNLHQSRRDKILEEFSSNPEVSVLIISKKAGAVGVNLTAANHIIIESLWWNPAIDSQAIDRVYRIGQTKEVHVHLLIARDTVDEMLFDIQERKRRLINAVIGDQSIADSTKLTRSDILDVFRKINTR
ncbi:hypothetical protein H4R24_000366 [Coemansia sp. RSA 988]|nr:hypothetical protein H4R24_000366 [Coemansia sp. RSA 988]